MKYVSIDLETTGLNVDTCQIIEFAAVLEDTATSHEVPVGALPVFHKYIVYNTYAGDPYALFLNAVALHYISCRSEHPEDDFTSPERLGKKFRDFIIDHNHCDMPTNDPVHVIPAGKNFGSFDFQFLRRLGEKFSNWVTFSHRVIDPAPLYWRPMADTRLPDMKTCMKRAGIEGTVAHTAVEDAQMVVRLLRKKYTQLANDNA
jgi:oligoribonuclease